MAVLDLFKRLVAPDPASGERRSDERQRAVQGTRILVVDDSATVRAVLGKMLMQDHYEVLKAADGESAVEMAQTQFPDLIFLDIVLPGMSGFAVLRALRRDPRFRAVPVVMMSGNQQATEQFYVRRFGADGFIKKPFGRAEVFHAVRLLVETGRMPPRAAMVSGGRSIASSDVARGGISAEEWNAIPDVAMPDAAHAPSPRGVAGDRSAAFGGARAAPSSPFRVAPRLATRADSVPALAPLTHGGAAAATAAARAMVRPALARAAPDAPRIPQRTVAGRGDDGSRLSPRNDAPVVPLLPAAASVARGSAAPPDVASKRPHADNALAAGASRSIGGPWSFGVFSLAIHPTLIVIPARAFANPGQPGPAWTYRDRARP